MWDAAAKAFLLGLSTGVFCLGTCAPVFVPMMMAEERKGWLAKLLPFLRFAAGRFIAYVFFGFAAGLSGFALKGKIPRLPIAVFLLMLGVVLILFGLKGGFPHLGLCRAAASWLDRGRAPFLFGLLMGFNLCPPFLAAFADVFVSGRILYGLAFFLVFFIVTTLFLFPFVFLGFLSLTSTLRTIAQLAAVVIGILYLVMGAVRILRG